MEFKIYHLKYYWKKYFIIFQYFMLILNIYLHIYTFVYLHLVAIWLQGNKQNLNNNLFHQLNMITSILL